MNKVWELVVRHRRRLAPLVLVLGLVVVGSKLFAAVPRETDIRYDLGPSHEEVRELRIAYELEGSAFRDVVLRYPGGAPRTVRHELDLEPGRYEIEVMLVRDDGARSEVRRALRAPAEGVVHVGLVEEEDL